MNNTYKCHFCGKELKQDEEVWHIDGDAEDYCYQDINSVEDIYNTCIGQELIKCGYSEKWIIDLFKSDLEDREIEIYFTTLE